MKEKRSDEERGEEEPRLCRAPRSERNEEEREKKWRGKKPRGKRIEAKRSALADILISQSAD
jgi:hypothetical protein